MRICVVGVRERMCAFVCIYMYKQARTCVCECVFVCASNSHV